MAYIKIQNFDGGAYDAEAAINSIMKHTRCFDHDKAFGNLQTLLDYDLAKLKHCLQGPMVVLKEGWREVLK